ncbi:MAG: hypothetical protein ACJ8AK_15450 [Gemmatimonadaceae bacterium]
MAAVVAVTVVSAATVAAQTRANRSDSIRAVAFDRLDREARTMLSTIDCARKTARARAAGLFGPNDSGRRGQCLRISDRPYGVFFTPDSTFTTANHMSVVDLTSQSTYSGVIDTASVLGEAKAAHEALLKGFPSFRGAKRQFAPLSFRFDGDSIEVWLVPIGSVTAPRSTTVGGERGYVYSPDGRTMAREVDAFDRFRSISVPDTGVAMIFSREDDLPLLSELLVANLLHGDGREVQIVTNTYASQLTGREPNSVWLQLRKR